MGIAISHPFSVRLLQVLLILFQTLLREQESYREFKPIQTTAINYLKHIINNQVKSNHQINNM